MPEGKSFEYAPEERIEATERTKEEFSGLVSNLLKGNVPAEEWKEGIGVSGEYTLGDKSIDVVYDRPESDEAVRNAFEGGVVPEVLDFRAKVTIIEKVSPELERFRDYILGKNGRLDFYSDIVKTSEVEKKKNPQEVLESTRKYLDFQKEHRKMGITLVMESELKEVNAFLRQIIENEKKKKSGGQENHS